VKDQNEAIKTSAVSSEMTHMISLHYGAKTAIHQYKQEKCYHLTIKSYKQVYSRHCFAYTLHSTSNTCVSSSISQIKWKSKTGIVKGRKETSRWLSSYVQSMLCLMLPSYCSRQQERKRWRESSPCFVRMQIQHNER